MINGLLMGINIMFMADWYGAKLFLNPYDIALNWKSRGASYASSYGHPSRVLKTAISSYFRRG